MLAPKDSSGVEICTASNINDITRRVARTHMSKLRASSMTSTTHVHAHARKLARNITSMSARGLTRTPAAYLAL
eukprot:7289597-Alexandrium_andersonii.AAC.1